MERLTPQSVHQQQEYLGGQKAWFGELADNLPNSGWIEEQIQKKPHFAAWAQGLRLTDLTSEERFDRLARVIIPLQQTLIGTVLPGIDGRLKQLEIQETERVRKLRDNFILDPLYAPIKDYSQVIFVPQIIKFLRNANQSTKELLTAFLESKGRSRIFNAIVNWDGVNYSNNNFNTGLSAAILEEVGYLFLSQGNLNKSTAILSPEETDLLFQNLYPDLFGVAGPYGFNHGVRGISVPDELIISDTGESLEIVAIVDYKNISSDNSDMSRMKVQREYYTAKQLAVHLRLKNYQPIDPADLGRLIHAIKPDLPEKPLKVSPKLYLLYVTPMNRSTYLDMRGIATDEVPISFQAIYAFGQTLKRVKLLQRGH
ncbi:hypothetical protein A3B45_01965 [Candidatus Daviesbacteria bacterium RIFCSPLOWO2_01_FULL_39_12]|uniref:Uncharacterized protein n=1 Tax=Candidatus Daviesbacteria bacterium RIFCSPLOWO2_01_FULL_39_12 TaxID=1797785 RepID=A0A1F5KLZ8_9BACT|nr:MAG: hypothetical protein A3D79_03170 [Candidatus Daviesbacteria bacterium RIFCSPHIGHO2_02_FULL_39_8]OGE41967.1 MAG: hypothetical protein A3B45_01965 [Candidatus Daviesbacteria bacterium RIFCSPLOWO2_01_FULL_39_12]